MDVRAGSLETGCRIDLNPAPPPSGLAREPQLTPVVKASWDLKPRRVVASLAVGFLLISALALAVVAKTAVEGLSSHSYEKHWLRTVPLLAVAAAWFVHGEWNRMKRGREG